MPGTGENSSRQPSDSPDYPGSSQVESSVSPDYPVKTVAVVGLGKIGLPLAAQYASKGMRVIGCDVLADVVESINAGVAHIHEEAGLEEAVAAAVAAGTLSATTDTTGAAKQAGVVVVIVPLIVAPDRSMDYRNIDAATRAVGRGLRRGTLVVYETTLPVGTTRQRLGPMLEKESGLKAGADFHLAFSPERLYAGRIFEDLRRYPKIVGGIDEASTKAAVDFYRSVLDAEVWAVENTETAEFAKLAETTYRDVNIALANQLALYAASREVNVSEAFKAANSQPYSHIHRPSLGVGGHCIPACRRDRGAGLAPRFPPPRLEALQGAEGGARRPRQRGSGGDSPGRRRLHRDRHLRDARRRAEVSRLEQLQVALVTVVAPHPCPSFAR